MKQLRSLSRHSNQKRNFFHKDMKHLKVTLETKDFEQVLSSSEGMSLSDSEYYNLSSSNHMQKQTKKFKDKENNHSIRRE